MKTRSTWLVIVLAAVMALMGVVAASAQTLTVYSSVDEENARNILNEFSKATGINVRFVFLSSGPALARMEAEQANPQADIWMGAPSENHVLAKERGLTQPYFSPNAEILAPGFKDSEGYWTSFYMNPMAVGVNLQWLQRTGAKMPETWADLLDPAFRNQIQMPTPQSSGTAYNLVASLVLAWGEDEAFDYLRKLDQNIQTYTQSGTAPSRAAAFGEAGVGIQFSPALLQLMDEGYPISVVFPADGVGYEAPAISIIKGAPNVEAAQALVDWILTLEAQNSFAKLKTFFFPIHPDAVAGEGLPPVSDIPLVEYDAVWAGEVRNELVNRWVDDVLRR